ncbi:S-formylglutathione hydrolase [Ramlibacter sp.]|uniref:S-formylglutathione hydrolase n=1 Tax=Ramlibacter sp. TaxID=1917967 RepID=UPI0026262F9A|nr:S-formylglutathione hydrolase [Ramlibacter sp.]MDB5954371.1 S-formylglutathione hydrolase [Ramlibacter sp.]
MQAPALLSRHGCQGGTQSFWQHESTAIGLPMRFGVFVPPQATQGRVPVLLYLAGLTCNEETFAIKAGAQAVAARLGVMVVSPDTSPRGVAIPGADADWDFGIAAGFYLDATRDPWRPHWRMESWIVDELPQLLAAHFPADGERLGICGHSMGGHGALTLALRHPGRFRTVSALAPIANPTQVPWGIKAFTGYLGEDRAAWRQHDAVELLRAGGRLPPLLVDQGLDDKFLADQLHPDALESVCRETGQPLTLRRHAGYDHGYYFVSTFIGEHLHHHYSGLA